MVINPHALTAPRIRYNRIRVVLHGSRSSGCNLDGDSSQQIEQVEVFRTSTLVEAAALCAALADAGIVAECSERMKHTGSCVFVPRGDEGRAQSVVHAFLTREAGDETSAARTHNECDQTESDVGSMTVVGKLIAIAGVACVLGGVAQAALGYISARRYPDKVAAHPVLDDERPWSPGGSGPPVVGYWYQVNGETFVIRASKGRMRPAEFVRYNPKDPLDHVLGEVLPAPYWVLAGVVVGVMLMFVAWQFGRPPTPGELNEFACAPVETTVEPI